MEIKRPQTNAYVLGVGLTQFIKPRQQRSYVELGFEAGVKAMLDAQIDFDTVEMGVGCFCFGPSCSGQRVFYQFGMTGIPVWNTNNACATGSTGLHMARTLIRSGAADCILVIGFEQMQPGSIKSSWDDRPGPMELTEKMMEDQFGRHESPRNCQYFANAGREYIEKYGASEDDFAEIGRISHEHSTRNPYAQFQQEYTHEQVKKSTMIHWPVTKLQCSPTSDGSGAAVIVSDRFLQARPHLRSQAILMAGQQLQTDDPSLYSKSAMDLCGFGMTKNAVSLAYKEAGITAKDIAVCELHDCFSANELILLEGLGFSGKGKAHEMVRRGDITYGGKGPIINPSGGLISKGHPLGATGLAQCAELTWQLRGWANNRHVDAKYALQHNLGLGGCVVVNIYRRADDQRNKKLSDQEVIARSSWKYNPATAAKTPSMEEARKVLSKKHAVEYALSNIPQLIQSRL